MLRTLYIVRHAKAEDRATFLPDHDRKLTPIGTIAAARIGRYLRQEAIIPGAIISSTAARAKSTASILAEQVGFDTAQINLDESIFESGPKAYLAAINAVPDTAQSAMIVGHNPDVSYLVEFLTHRQIGSMRTGAVVAITFEDLTWADVSGRTGNIAFQVSPKELNKD